MEDVSGTANWNSERMDVEHEKKENIKKRMRKFAQD